jgi:hypothetical protein
MKGATFKIIYLKDKEEWQEKYSLLPIGQQDIYYTPEYYALYENNGDGQACCFVFEQDNDIALYPFLKNSINDLGYDLDKEYYDIQGAYGYNGVIASSYNNCFIALFQRAFDEYINKSFIIAEFTRFNPVLNNHIFSQYLTLQHDQDNILVDLNLRDLEKESYEYTTLKNVRKAIRNNLKCICLKENEIDITHLNAFIEIYYSTIGRNKAETFYYFPDSFFISLIKTLSKNCTLYFVEHNGEKIATELVLFGNEIAYSFLGGTLSENYELRPNDYLKDYIIKDLKCKGLKTFCLGGGSKGVFNYKKKFAKHGIIPFFIGGKIHNKRIYESVINQWSSKSPEKVSQYSKYFLKYRY